MPEYTPLEILAMVAATMPRMPSAPAPAPAPVPVPGLASGPDPVSASPSPPSSPPSPHQLPSSPHLSPSPCPAASLPSPPRTPAPAPARPAAPSGSRDREPRRCTQCGRTFSFKNFADHLKVHKMEGSEGAPAIPCPQCEKHPERCRVAIHPRQLGTFACLGCLKSHKPCEFTGGRKVREIDWADEHPNLLNRPGTRNKGLSIEDILN